MGAGGQKELWVFPRASVWAAADTLSCVPSTLLPMTFETDRSEPTLGLPPLFPCGGMCTAYLSAPLCLNLNNESNSRACLTGSCED